jgi:hypothetical protein
MKILICSLIITAVPLFGYVKMQVREGRPIVDGVYVNGHGPYRFLVDTGANVNLIENGLARTIGMHATFQVDLASAAGKTLMLGSDGNEVNFDSVKANGQKFLFSGLEAIHRCLPDVQGVLGQWFLAGFDYVLDLRGKRLDFGKQSHSGMRAPFRMLNGRTVVATSLGDLVLDSGSARLILFGVDADNVDKGYLRTVAGSQMVGMRSSTLAIENRTMWRGDAVAIRNQAEPGVAGLMPVSVFKAIYVCNSEGYVVFE